MTAAVDQGRWLLAFETATAAISVALFRGEGLVVSRRAEPGPAAETLLLCVHALLNDVGANIADIDTFGVSVGPGSFTSLRVGVATAKGLAFGAEAAHGMKPAGSVDGTGAPGRVRVAAVSTLAALADRFAAIDAVIVPVLDARRGEVYAAGYRGLGREPSNAGVAAPILPESVYTPAALIDSLPRPIRFVGEGASIVAAAIAETDRSGIEFIDVPEAVATAESVGSRAVRLIGETGGISASDLVPRYVRRAEAEVKRTGERFEA